MTQRMGNQSNNVCGDVLGPIEVITHEMESYVAEEIWQSGYVTREPMGNWVDLPERRRRW